MSRKTDIFAAYGDDAEAALRNWQQIDPLGFDAWESDLARRQYLTDYRKWSGARKVSVTPPATEPAPSLFPAPAKVEAIQTRPTVVHDGHEHTLLDLAGSEGATVLRQAALRDLTPAESTAKRCRFHLRIADLIEAETVRQGRPVSVGEVIGLAVAS